MLFYKRNWVVTEPVGWMTLFIVGGNLWNVVYLTMWLIMIIAIAF